MKCPNFKKGPFSKFSLILKTFPRNQEFVRKMKFSHETISTVFPTLTEDEVSKFFLQNVRKTHEKWLKFNSFAKHSVEIQEYFVPKAIQSSEDFSLWTSPVLKTQCVIFWNSVSEILCETKFFRNWYSEPQKVFKGQFLGL